MEGLFGNHSKPNEINSKEDIVEKQEQKATAENEDEELWKRLKQYALKKKYQDSIIKVPGQFEVNLFRYYFSWFCKHMLYIYSSRLYN